MLQDLLFYCTKKVPKNHNSLFTFVMWVELISLWLAQTLIHRSFFLLFIWLFFSGLELSPIKMDVLHQYGFLTLNYQNVIKSKTIYFSWFIVYLLHGPFWGILPYEKHTVIIKWFRTIHTFWKINHFHLTKRVTRIGCIKYSYIDNWNIMCKILFFLKYFINVSFPTQQQRSNCYFPNKIVKVFIL